MKFLLDENLSPRQAETMRELGHDAVSVAESGLAGADDTVRRRAAIESGRILVTLDGDFANVLRFPPWATPGVTAFTPAYGRSNRRGSSLGDFAACRHAAGRQARRSR